jgi:hypothetical protein
LILIACLALTSIATVSRPAFAQTKTLPSLYAIQLGTTPPVQVMRYEGGEPVGSVLTSVGPGAGLPNKSPGPVQYRDLVLEYLPVPGAALNTLISDVLAGNSQPVSGAIVIMDSLKKELSRLNFYDALVRSIEFSDMDVTLTGQAPIVRIALAVPMAQVSAGSNQIVTYSPWVKGPQKSSYRLLIQGLDAAAQKSPRIEPQKFTVVITATPTQSGPSGPSMTLGAGARDYSNLIILLPESEAGPFITWHQQLTSQPQNSDQLEKTGLLEWLSSDKTKTHVSLQLQHLGIVSVIRLPNKPGYMAVEMYCEKIVPQVF